MIGFRGHCNVVLLLVWLKQAFWRPAPCVRRPSLLEQALYLEILKIRAKLRVAMPARRAPCGGHSGHIEAKRRKLAREGEEQDRLEDAVAFRDGVNKLTQQLKTDPNAVKMLRRCQQAVSACSYQAETKERFGEDLEGRPLKRMPPKFLKDRFLPAVGQRVAGAPPELKDPKTIQLIAKKDPKAPLNTLTRLACVSKKDPVGPMDKNEWLEVYLERINQVGGWPDDLRLTLDYELNFNISGGHYKVMPPMTDDVKPEDHRYTHFLFVGRSFPFTGPLANAITAEWRLHENADHLAAFIEHPKYKNHASRFLDFLVNFEMKALVAPLIFQPIGDNRVQAPAGEDATKELPSTVVIEELPDGVSQSVGSAQASAKKPADAESTSSSAGSVAGIAAVEKTPEQSALGPAKAGGIVVSVPGLRPSKSNSKKKMAMEKLAALPTAASAEDSTAA